MKSPMISEARHVKFQALGLDQPIRRRIVYDDVSKIRLARNRAKARELWDREPRQIERTRVGIGYTFKFGCFWTGWSRRDLAKLPEAGDICCHASALTCANRSVKGHQQTGIGLLAPA
jgi:hypothetical protein